MGKSYSVVMGWVKARLSFAVLRATLLCVQGFRVRLRSVEFVDGASICEGV